MLQQINPPSPWHAGEVALQTYAGVAERLAEIGPRVMRDHLIEQHRVFYPLLPMVVLGTVDPDGNAWATMRTGLPGFLQAVDEHHLHVGTNRDPADPADAGLEEGAAVGLLGIDMRTRRRNRLNGTLVRSDEGFDLAVMHSFGNCPKYIQLRQPSFRRDPRVLSDAAPIHGTALDERAREIITAADTFFVASYADIGGRRQIDVSHRGGRTGFVRIDGDGTLTIPDFAGNLFFNTLGNFLVNPKAGLVFADFETGELVQLTGDADVILDSPDIAEFEGAERLWRFHPRHMVRRPDALPLRWTLEEWSPFNLATGSWGKGGAI